jgi:hypothetical protein
VNMSLHYLTNTNANCLPDVQSVGVLVCNVIVAWNPHAELIEHYLNNAYDNMSLILVTYTVVNSL